MNKESIKAGAILVNAIEATQNVLQAFKESYVAEKAPILSINTETGEEEEIVDTNIEMYVALNHNAGIKVVSKTRQDLIFKTCLEEMEEGLVYLEKKVEELE